MSRLDYSKWDHIEVSDDEDDTHPNIDTPSLFRWRHDARVERMKQAQKEKDDFIQEKRSHQQKAKEVEKKMQEVSVQGKTEEVDKLESEMQRLQEEKRKITGKEKELAKKERLTPLNVDTLSRDGFQKTIINKPKKVEELSEEEKHKKMLSFMDKYEKEIKHYGMLGTYSDSREYLRDHPHLVCEDTASFLTLWCVNLQAEGKTSLMERVAHQAVTMQYILELAKQLDRDPRSCAPGFFTRIVSAEKQYITAFKDELGAFVGRVKQRAKVKLEEAMKEAEEEERKKRLGPGGLDPVEVMESLPPELKECFESRSVSKLQDVLSSMGKEQAAEHMRRCVDSGLWVSDAKSAGLTPASEQLRQEQVKECGEKEEEEEEEEEVYEDVGEGPADIGVD